MYASTAFAEASRPIVGRRYFSLSRMIEIPRVFQSYEIIYVRLSLVRYYDGDDNIHPIANHPPEFRLHLGREGRHNGAQTCMTTSKRPQSDLSSF